MYIWVWGRGELQETIWSSSLLYSLWESLVTNTSCPLWNSLGCFLFLSTGSAKPKPSLEDIMTSQSTLTKLKRDKQPSTAVKGDHSPLPQQRDSYNENANLSILSLKNLLIRHSFLPEPIHESLLYTKKGNFHPFSTFVGLFNFYKQHTIFNISIAFQILNESFQTFVSLCNFLKKHYLYSSQCECFKKVCLTFSSN